MKQPISLFANYSPKFLVSDFNILKVEDFFNDVGKDTLNKNQKVDFYTIFLVTEDIGRHTIDYKDYYYFKGTVLAIRKDQFQRFHINKNVKGYLLFFNEEFLNRFLNDEEVSSTLQMFNELLASPKTQLEKKEFEKALKIIKEIEDENSRLSDSYSLKIIRSSLHILITLIHRVKTKGINKVQLTNYLKEFIKFQNLLEKEFNNSKKVNFYSEKLGFSSKKLNSIVNYVANKSAKSFIDDVIIIKAKKDLLHSSLSVKEIAYKLGFKDPTNFFKYFKKNTSFTPESYKKRYKK